MAANFAVTPHIVTLEKRDYHTIETQAEDMNKEYYKLTSNAQVQYRLRFTAVNSSTMNTILGHYDACFGAYDSFTWTTVPSYISSGSSMSCHWVANTLDITPAGMKYWNIEGIFEKDV